MNRHEHLDSGNAADVKPGQLVAKLRMWIGERYGMPMARQDSKLQKITSPAGGAGVRNAKLGLSITNKWADRERKQ